MTIALDSSVLFLLIARTHIVSVSIIYRKNLPIIKVRMPLSTSAELTGLIVWVAPFVDGEVVHCLLYLIHQLCSAVVDHAATTQCDDSLRASQGAAERTKVFQYTSISAHLAKSLVAHISQSQFQGKKRGPILEVIGS